MLIDDHLLPLFAVTHSVSKAVQSFRNAAQSLPRSGSVTSGRHLSTSGRPFPTAFCQPRAVFPRPEIRAEILSQTTADVDEKQS